MIGLALLLLAGFGWLAVKGYFGRGWAGASGLRRLAIAAGGGIGLILLLRGQLAPGLALLGLAGFFAFRERVRARVRRLSMDEVEARHLLGVGLAASRADILAAHRQKIRAVHPDRPGGGDPALASRLNAARDFLLERLPVKAASTPDSN